MFEWQVDKNAVPTLFISYNKLLCNCFEYLLKRNYYFLTTSNYKNKSSSSPETLVSTSLVKWNWHWNFKCSCLTSLIFYRLSRETVNTRENFWNVYCFATYQMRDETAKDSHQTAALISHYLTQNNELAFSSTRNLQFYCFQILIFFFLDFGL